MKRYKIHITKGSVNLIRDFRNYKWKEELADSSTKEPIDKFNRVIDANRYALLANVMINSKRMVKVGKV